MVDLWDTIDYQKQQAKNQDIFKQSYLSHITNSKNLDKAISDAQKHKHGLVYHTKATGLPCHQWYLGDRVVVYLNPSEGHLNNEMYNNKRGLEEYILNEFGCTKDFFEKLIKSNALFVKLDEKDKYPSKIQYQIEQLLNQHHYSENIIFAKAIETSISSNLHSSDFDQLLNTEMKNTSFNNINLINNNSPMTVRGVVWNNSFGKVKENYARLKILHDYFSIMEHEDEKCLIDSNLQSFQSPVITTAQELADFAYDTYLKLGTPIYYSLMSGTNSMGVASLNQSIITKNNGTDGKKFELIKSSIMKRGKRKKSNGDIRQLIEGWGAISTSNISNKLDIISTYENWVIKSLNESGNALIRPYVLDLITDLVPQPIIYYLSTSKLEYAISQAFVDIAMFSYSYLKDRRTAIPLKAGSREPWMKQENTFNIMDTEGFYRKVSFKMFSFNYVINLSQNPSNKGHIMLYKELESENEH